MCDQSVYPFYIYILRLIAYGMYKQYFSSYFYVDSWHELANYALSFAVIYDCILYIMFCKLLFVRLSQQQIKSK